MLEFQDWMDNQDHQGLQVPKEIQEVQVCQGHPGAPDRREPVGSQDTQVGMGRREQQDCLAVRVSLDCPGPLGSMVLRVTLELPGLELRGVPVPRVTQVSPDSQAVQELRERLVQQVCPGCLVGQELRATQGSPDFKGHQVFQVLRELMEVQVPRGWMGLLVDRVSRDALAVQELQERRVRRGDMASQGLRDRRETQVILARDTPDPPAFQDIQVRREILGRLDFQGALATLGRRETQDSLAHLGRRALLAPRGPPVWAMWDPKVTRGPQAPQDDPVAPAQ
ncbi:hypothetical protein AAFF_G00312580 [Aldrovandia affinis]|uniref:Uncharacterized protein n=1 Tax=Aldrovandia affinis TaxID=143900 RepID=A0AAD7WQM1_9TELE|nr:hypothetical protein AAFF_G00312580 [Aldrovandia affinis]